MPDIRQGEARGGVPPVVGPRGVVPPPLPGVPPVVLPGTVPERARVRVADPLLEPEHLDRFRDLLLFAQTTVDGYFAGKHRSPHPGSSSEFRDYRDYVAGDPLDRIDWRAYGRSRRLFIRRYEDETDMVAYLLVDASASMRYAGGGRATKFRVASRIAAAIAYLMLHQGDKAALGLFADQLRTWVPSGGTRRHLYQMVRTLEAAEPSQTTGISRALSQCAGYVRKRGRLIVLSDFLTPTAPLMEALSQFLHRGFGILLLQVLDPDEMRLPDHAVARFVDMETGDQVEVDVDELRAGYVQRMEESLRELAREAEGRRIEYQRLTTDAPYTAALEAYLGFRGGRR